jgi:magnesium transporter
VPLRECLRYVDGHRHPEGSIDLDRAAEIARGTIDDEGFVWIAMVDPTAGELADLERRFGLGELAVEDALSVHERPKIDFYPESGMAFAVVRAALYDDEQESVRFTEVSMFLSERFVITVRPTGDHELLAAQRRAERRPDLLRHGPTAVLWALLDTTVDNYAPVVAGLEEDVDEIEATVFGGHVAATERIYRLRGQATAFGRAVHPLIAPVDALRRGTYPLVPKPLLPFFRDVSDHLRLVDEEVAAQRDALGSILQANLAVISLQQTEVGVRQNDAVRILTVISTIFLPLTFITGFFGQNFGWLDDHTHSLPVFAVVGLGSLVVSVFGLWLWFRHTGLVGRDDPA